MTTFSPFLEGARQDIRNLVGELRRRFDFVSVLGTDCVGTNYEVLPSERRASESMWTERGFALRAMKDGRIAEYSFNEPDFDPDRIAAVLEALTADVGAESFLKMDGSETPLKDSFLSGADAPDDGDPLALPTEAVLDRLEVIRRRAAEASPLIVMARTRAEWVRVSKLYISADRELDQSYLWGQAYVFVAARRDGKTRQSFEAVSGLAGTALLDQLEGLTPAGAESPPKCAARTAVELLDAVSMEPGEYTVVLSPDMAGMLAHEAFGHGVETDMMAKGRSKALHYIGKRVGSPLVTMHDGALSARQNGSYLFDDEGTPGSATLVLDRGILRSGISDLLSAKELSMAATGNGRRWSYERKAYARMTNTFFGPGESDREDLIADVAYGWLLDRPNSGMEDPKNWGIQLVALVGREIKDGKLTGKIASPVVCTGYVPEVLGAVDAVADTVELKGNGYCGKGHKEFVKVSSGGPWMRTRMRLG